MKRKERTEILINGSPEIAKRLAEEIESRYKVAVIEKPNQGLVMVRVRETAQKSLFYLGEVLVTECKIQIEDAIGIGMIKGNEPERACNLAIIDAAYAAGLNETSGWSDILQSEKIRIEAERTALHAQMLRTKVNFEMMDTED